MTAALVTLALLLLAERAWRVLLVVRFFRRPPPPPLDPAPRLVSILQPVVGGDPTLSPCLEASLRAETAYNVETWYLLDEGDADAERVCRDLEARYPGRVAGLLFLPPPPEGVSPKLFKMIAGIKASKGDVVCCLDDDTMLPDGGLEECLPHLARPGVGLAFGLPYYVHFGNAWSAYVSCFVNASSLLTYVPYTALTEPFTINGMFYALRREVLAEIGNFEDIRHIIADDFAVAHRVRSAGYKLAQTPVRHGISTHVRDLGHLRGLLGRWFTFPRESLLRHLSAKERAIVVAMGVVANALPVVLAVGVTVFPSPAALAAASVFFAFALVTTAFFNRAFLRGATPPWALWLMTPLVLLVFPLQMLAALLAPRQRVNWRGNLMEAEKGGGFRFVRRRDADV
jgi:ceramide glucosyltransferase